jgi:hypothetical protein
MMIADVSLTRHAAGRCQQRSVPPIIVDWLLNYGARVRADGGAEIVFFDKRALRALERSTGPGIVARLSDVVRGTYAIVADDGAVITVGHRYRRVERDRVRVGRRMERYC